MMTVITLALSLVALLIIFSMLFVSSLRKKPGYRRKSRCIGYTGPERRAPRKITETKKDLS